MKKFVCVGCNNEFDNKTEAEACCGEEAEEIDEKEPAEDDNEETGDETELL